jgi:hypothetical protein
MKCRRRKVCVSCYVKHAMVQYKITTAEFCCHVLKNNIVLIILNCIGFCM